MKSKSIKFNKKKLKIVIEDKLRKELLDFRQLNDDDFEIGGVLMGELYPQSNKIKVTHFLTCDQSSSSINELHLNVECLQSMMDDIWKQSEGTITYLGDWHTHPENNPKPSIIDYKTFMINYYKSEFNQNILLYMILGKKDNIWFKAFDGFKFIKIHNL